MSDVQNVSEYQHHLAKIMNEFVISICIFLEFSWSALLKEIYLQQQILRYVTAELDVYKRFDCIEQTGNVTISVVS